MGIIREEVKTKGERRSCEEGRSRVEGEAKRKEKMRV